MNITMIFMCMIRHEVVFEIGAVHKAVVFASNGLEARELLYKTYGHPEWLVDMNSAVQEAGQLPIKATKIVYVEHFIKGGNHATKL